MNLLEIINQFTKNIFGIGIVDAWQQAPQTKQASQKAAELAQKKHLRQAITIGETALAFWSKNPGFWERWLTQLLLGNLLKQLTQQTQEWRKQVATANKLAANAKNLLKQDTGDPWETQTLANAINIYQRCSKILHDERLLQAINRCQGELDKRQQFQGLVQQAQSQAENRYFKNAIAIYSQAQQLYSTQALTEAIANATAQATQEAAFEASLQRARQGESEGKLRGAIALLQSAVAKFPRTDGQVLLNKLQSIIKGRELYRQGLAAEKAGDFKTAISLYENAQYLLPDVSNCRIRLALVAIKIQDWGQAISHLEGLDSEQAAYLRGFAYAQQQNLQLAYREWQSLSSKNIAPQREILKTLSQRQRLLYLQNIEQLVKAENLPQAKTASTKFIEKFGYDSLVEENLQQHIQPRLEIAVWQSANWEVISEQAEKDWMEQPNIITLHNWAVANYYHAQTDSSKLSHLIISLATALANLHQDINLQDVPWLGNKSVDFAAISAQLKHRLEAMIDIVKDSNLHDYFNLRDTWRLESVALELIGKTPVNGVKINDIFVTPGCYQHYISGKQTSLNKIDTSEKILHCLYTTWGLAVAACIVGDSQRAIKLKPTNQANSELEIFAQQFVAYHEGCYYLQQQTWREAINPFKQAQPQIQTNQEWQEEIDRLCSLQRRNISENTEHLAFAQFWYDVINSANARAYLAEYKAEQVREEVANEKITKQQALEKLERIKLIDVENPIVLDLMQSIENAIALDAIKVFFDKNDLEGAVRYAKQNGQTKVKNIVAEICIDILIDGFKTRKLGFRDIYELGSWAYELNPENPTVRQMYIIAQEVQEIGNLIKRDRYEEAVRHAQYSQYDGIRYYVGDYFMMILIKGIENNALSSYLVHQLCRWACELCPDNTDYQAIRRRLNGF
ncbi:tetratricopeptide repeat protein [Anabaena sp. CA = ATCC 33047]|uniref:tetratricopeptide repeat protein n=1 Tax=Anabaena sp. (strain CA / ATCC 33047) TaxID=52271 RepID=UPI00082BA385|nr:peptidase M, neutral zinc metallopeptidase site [Anabaena sp. CA = ATCC 33047]